MYVGVGHGMVVVVSRGEGAGGSADLVASRSRLDLLLNLHEAGAWPPWGHRVFAAVVEWWWWNVCVVGGGGMCVWWWHVCVVVVEVVLCVYVCVHVWWLLRSLPLLKFGLFGLDGPADLGEHRRPVVADPAGGGGGGGSGGGRIKDWTGVRVGIPRLAS